ncbi:hypothetical protein HA466_0285540 [Hirschfeldia incana]|nr:hypothetical protein HA466_0285540 [Hirschfeldia incana]
MYHHLYSLPPISTFRFQSLCNPSCLSLRTYTYGGSAKRLKYICSNPSPMWLCGFKSPSQFTQWLRFLSESLSSSALRFCFVGSQSPLWLHPHLQISFSAQVLENDASDSFRVVSSLPPVESCLLLACDGQRTRSKTTLDGSRERTGLEVGFFH